MGNIRFIQVDVHLLIPSVSLGVHDVFNAVEKTIEALIDDKTSLAFCFFESLVFILFTFSASSPSSSG